MTLAKTPIMGAMGHELPIIDMQVRLPLGGMRHQHSHKTFSLQLVLSGGSTLLMVMQKLWSGQQISVPA